MANTLATSSIVAKEALAILENMLGFSKYVNRDYEGEFSSNMSRGYAPGQTINIKKPPRYTYRAGRVSVPQATVENTVPLTLSQGGTDANFTGLERTLSITNDGVQQKLRAAMAAVANEIDRQGLDLARTSVFNVVGTAGTPPNTQALATDLILSAQQKLDENAAPRDDYRAMVAGPGMNRYLVAGTQGYFNSQTVLDKQYKSGLLNNPLGLDFALDQNVATQTNGTLATGSNVNGAGQTGASITVAATTGTMTKGQKITFGTGANGVYAVNPQTRLSTGSLQQFVLTADVPNGSTSLPISPAIVTTGAFQNVTNSPVTGQPFALASGGASTAYPVNIAFHKDAYTLAAVPMFMPPSKNGVVDVAQETYKGMNMKVTTFYDGVNDNYVTRFDVLFGWAATYPELSVAVLGA